MSGVFLMGAIEGKAHAERVTGPVEVQGVELLVRLDLGGEADPAQAKSIEVLVSRDPDDTLVFRFPDGRIQRAVVCRDGKKRWVSAAGRTLSATEVVKKRGAVDLNPSLEAPMPGKVARVMVKVGDRVQKGQTLVTVESPKDGIVESLSAVEGELVSPGTALVKVGELPVESA
jgi:acetyl/propionyl-CoA carboxylase alpha subunit